MAGTPVEAIKQIIYNEDINSGSGISEDLMHKLASSVMWILNNSSDIIGEKKDTFLTEAQFAQLKGYALIDESNQPIPEAQKKWILMKGQDITGSDLANLTGFTNASDFVGKEAHFAQALNEGAIMTYQESQNKAHTHNATFKATTSPDGTVTAHFDNAHGSGTQNKTAATTSEGGTYANPNRYMGNMFLKINN